MFWEIIREKSILYVPVLFVHVKLHRSLHFPWPLRTCIHHFQLRVGQKAPFVYPPVAYYCHCGTHPCISICLLSTTTPTHDNKWTMVLSDVSEWFICKTKPFSYYWQQMPYLAPLVVNILYLYLHCPDLTPPGGRPDLHAHSFPNWALNPDKGRWKKGEKRKQNLIFMVNWEVTGGNISGAFE